MGSHSQRRRAPVVLPRYVDVGRGVTDTPASVYMDECASYAGFPGQRRRARVSIARHLGAGRGMVLARARLSVWA